MTDLVSAVLVSSCGHTHTHTHTHIRTHTQTDSNNRYTNATTVDVSNYDSKRWRERRPVVRVRSLAACEFVLSSPEVCPPVAGSPALTPSPDDVSSSTQSFYTRVSNSDVSNSMSVVWSRISVVGRRQLGDHRTELLGLSKVYLWCDWLFLVQCELLIFHPFNGKWQYSWCLWISASQSC